eukprot:12709-Heterococcus_DN1.PRE.1
MADTGDLVYTQESVARSCKLLHATVACSVDGSSNVNGATVSAATVQCSITAMQSYTIAHHSANAQHAMSANCSDRQPELVRYVSETFSARTLCAQAHP